MDTAELIYAVELVDQVVTEDEGMMALVLVKELVMALGMKTSLLGVMLTPTTPVFTPSLPPMVQLPSYLVQLEQ